MDSIIDQGFPTTEAGPKPEKEKTVKKPKAAKVKKAPKKAKTKKPAAKKAKKSKVVKTKRDRSKPLNIKPAARSGNGRPLVRFCRLDMRLPEPVKERLIDKARKAQRTVTSIVQEAVENIIRK